jgi:uncharacterized RDD family membrane protein YckC
MEISEAELREQYRNLSAQELIELRRRNTLTELAAGILEDELKRRGLSIQDSERLSKALENLQKEERDSAYLASLGERFIAQILDGVITLLLIIGGGLLIQELVFVWLCLGIAYLWFADALPNGQSLGKRAVNISVIDAKNGRPCTVLQSFIRNFLLSLLGIFDWIFIASEKRQRLGDMAASTIVIKVKQPVST